MGLQDHRRRELVLVDQQLDLLCDSPRSVDGLIGFPNRIIIFRQYISTIGKDREFFETQEGKLIDAKGVTARYLRSYTKGSSLSAFNVHEEIEVYGLPAGQ